VLRRASFAVLSIVVGLGLGCVLVEAGFRVAGAIQDVDYRIYLQELKNPNSLPLAIWAAPMSGGGRVAVRAPRIYPPLRPHARVLATTADFSVIYRINGRGLRDREYALPKPPGVRRVLAFGDSFTFGSGVADDERFSEVAEAALDGVEIVNMGVPGYGLDQILLSFLAQGRAWQPDDVVVFLNRHVANRHLTGIVREGAVHVPSNLTAVDFSGDGGDTLYVAPDDALQRNGRSWLARHSYALAFLSYRLALRAFQERDAAQAKKRWSVQRMLGRQPLGADPDLARRARTRLLVETLRDAVRDAGAHLTIVNIDRRQSAGYLADVEGIRLVDLAPELYARGRTTELTFRYDQHYNADTHRWLGKRLRDILASTG
jgi:hypothetical protein